MSSLIRLSERRMERIWHLFPTHRCRPEVDDLRTPSGLIHVNRNGLRRCDAPPEYGSCKTLCNGWKRWKRWSGRGVFLRFLDAPAGAGGDANDTPMIDATHRTESSLKLGKRGDGRHIGRTKGGLNSMPHAMTEAVGRPVLMIRAAGRISDHTGARTLVNRLPDGAKRSVAGRGHDADRFRRSSRRGRSIRASRPAATGWSRSIGIRNPTGGGTLSRTSSVVQRPAAGRDAP